jgi:hypothetical protein
MKMYVSNEPIIVVLLNSAAENAHIEDARRVRQWLQAPAGKR